MAIFSSGALEEFSNGILRSAGEKPLNVTFDDNAAGVIPTKVMVLSNDAQPGILGYSR